MEPTSRPMGPDKERTICLASTSSHRDHQQDSPLTTTPISIHNAASNVVGSVVGRFQGVVPVSRISLATVISVQPVSVAICCIGHTVVAESQHVVTTGWCCPGPAAWQTAQKNPRSCFRVSTPRQQPLDTMLCNADHVRLEKQLRARTLQKQSSQFRNHRNSGRP